MKDIWRTEFHVFFDRYWSHTQELMLLSQCAARLPRHRAFDFGYLANKWGNSKISQKGMQTQLPKTWWQTSGRTQKATKNPSKNLQKSLKMGSWTIPGALGGGSGTSLAPGRPRARKGHQKAAKYYSVFGPKMETLSNFSWFFFQCFLRCSRCRFFMILGACGPHFGFHFGSTLRALGLWENSWKCCKGCQFHRFGPCQTECFYRSWLWVRFGDRFFAFFCDF